MEGRERPIGTIAERLFSPATMFQHMSHMLLAGIILDMDLSLSFAETPCDVLPGTSSYTCEVHWSKAQSIEYESRSQTLHVCLLS